MLAAPLPMFCGMNLHSPRLWTLALTSLVVLGVVAVTLATGAANGAENGGGHGLPRGDAFLPPKGKIFTGASDTGQSSDYHEFRADTRAHPAIMQSFESWGYVPKEALGRWLDTNTRGMLSLSTAKCWKCPDVISPQSIAEGKGDRYIVALARALAHRRKPTYIRLMPEMNGYWNRYSAYGSDGQVRDRFHTTADFKSAWRRFVLIARGGPVKAIDRRLRTLRMPKLTERTARKLPRPKVSFAWVPQSTGSPDVKGNRPRDYFPGWKYVDWVGADVYGKFPNIAGVNSLYKQFSKRPFLIGEWSSWDVDNPRFVKALFDWIEHHHRANMAIYYQGFGEGADNPYELSDYPRSTKVMRHILNERKYAPFAPENDRGHRGRGGKDGRGR
jgi:hypothetical protein